MRLFVYIFGFGLWVLGAVCVSSVLPVVTFAACFMLVMCVAVFLLLCLVLVDSDICAGDSGIYAQGTVLKRRCKIRQIRVSLAVKTFVFSQYVHFIWAVKYIRVLARLYEQARRL